MPTMRSVPQRASAKLVASQIQEIRAWETASENSEEFRAMASQIDTELKHERLPDNEEEEATASVESEDVSSDSYESSFVVSDDDGDEEFVPRKRARTKADSSTEHACEEADTITHCMSAWTAASAQDASFFSALAFVKRQMFASKAIPVNTDPQYAMTLALALHRARAGGATAPSQAEEEFWRKHAPQPSVPKY